MMTDVLIVGAGPTGLMMACLLHRSGISFKIIDRQIDRAKESRALVVHAKSMELFQNLGLDQDFLRQGKKSIGLGLFVDGKQKAKIDFGDIGIEGTPFPYLLFISQSQTEQILIDHLEKNGVKIERQTELVSFTQDSTGVDCVLKNVQGGEEKIRCKYLLGCDGAHSKVRQGLNLDFSGGSYEQNFALADVKIDWPYEKDRLMIFMTLDGIFAHFPLNDQVSRLIITQTTAPKDPRSEPDLAEIQELSEKFTKIPLKVSDPIWLARFHLHHRGVDKYRVGRCFVAGDAAHIHSPVGGQGMNTGLQDAANLAWKLALVLQNVAPEKILDTYHDERHRIGQVLLKTTDRFFALAVTKNKFLAKLRNLFLPILAKLFLSRISGRKRVFRFVSQLAIRYHNNFLTHEMISDEGFRNGPEPGCRAPDGKLDARTLFEAFKNNKIHVVVFMASEVTMDPRFQHFQTSFMDVHSVKTQPGNKILYQRYGIIREGVYIIRPDGYILYRSDKIDFDAVQRYLNQLFHL